jgi:hypothetical protein
MASRFLFALCALATLGGSVLGRPNVAIAGAQVTAQYIIRNVTTGKCIDIANGSTAAGAEVAQYICHGGQNQRFRFDFPLPGSGLTRISNVHSYLCIVPTGYQGPSTPRMGLVQSSCTAPEASFNLVRATHQGRVGERVVLRWAFDSTFCIDVPSAARTDGLILQAYRCHGGLNQLWDIAR